MPKVKYHAYTCLALGFGIKYYAYICPVLRLGVVYYAQN